MEMSHRVERCFKNIYIRGFKNISQEKESIFEGYNFKLQQSGLDLPGATWAMAQGDKFSTF